MGSLSLASYSELSYACRIGDTKQQSQLRGVSSSNHTNSCSITAASIRSLQSLKMGLLEDAQEVAKDPDYRFGLVLQLDRLYIAECLLRSERISSFKSPQEMTENRENKSEDKAIKD